MDNYPHFKVDSWTGVESTLVESVPSHSVGSTHYNRRPHHYLNKDEFMIRFHNTDGMPITESMAESALQLEICIDNNAPPPPPTPCPEYIYECPRCEVSTMWTRIDDTWSACNSCKLSGTNELKSCPGCRADAFLYSVNGEIAQCSAPDCRTWGSDFFRNPQ